MAGTLTIASKEIRDQMGSKRFLILFGLVVLLSAVSAYQGIDYIQNNTDAGFNSIFSGTQFGFSFIYIMVFFGPLLGLSLGFDAINKERANGTLSILLGQPIFRDSVINGKLIAGAAALGALVIGTIGIMSGITIPLLGFGPTKDEFARIIVLTILTIIYLVFWQSLGLLYSVLAKKTTTSIMASIATWLVFSIVITVLASAIAGVMVPLPEGDFRPGAGGQGTDFKIADEFREAMQERAAIQDNIGKISPTNLYNDAATDILGVRSTGFGIGRGFQEFDRTLSLTEALAANWANIATIIVGLVVCFASSYMMFLRSEIRPGE